MRLPLGSPPPLPYPSCQAPWPWGSYHWGPHPSWSSPPPAVSALPGSLGVWCLVLGLLPFFLSLSDRGSEIVPGFLGVARVDPDPDHRNLVFGASCVEVISLPPAWEQPIGVRNKVGVLGGWLLPPPFCLCHCCGQPPSPSSRCCHPPPGRVHCSSPALPGAYLASRYWHGLTPWDSPVGCPSSPLA